MILALLGVASASDFILAQGADVGLGRSGTFARPMHLEDGWWLSFGAGGELRVAPLSKSGDRLEDWEIGGQDLVLSDSGGILRDHSMVPCPDGSWLHLGSSSITNPDDSAFAWRYNADFQITASGTVADQISERSHNDPAVVCGATFQGVAYPYHGTPRNEFLWFDAGVQVDSVWPLQQDPRMSGGALVQDGEDLLAFGFDIAQEMKVVRYDSELAHGETFEVLVVPEPERAYWPQGVLRVGDHWLVAVMVRDDAVWGEQDDLGNVHLSILSSDFEVVERHPLTFHEPGEGGQRPWLALHEDQLLVGFDRVLDLSLIELTLDLDAFEGGLDSGPVDSGHTGDTGPQDSGGGSDDDCGCGSATAPLWIGVWMPLLLRHRRRS